MRRLRSSLEQHPPFTPLVLKAWIPLGLTSIVLAVLAIVLDSTPVLLASFVAGSIAGPVAFLVDFQYRTGLAALPPRSALLSGALVGGPLAVGVSALLESGFAPIGMNWSTVLIGPIEEFAKLLVPVALLGAHRVSQRAALLCAICSAASFQVIENLLTAVGTLHMQGAGASTAVLASRGLIGPFTHCMWTTTIALAWFGTRDYGMLRDVRVHRLLGWFVLVSLLHSLWDVSTGTHPQLLALALAGTAFVGTLLAHHAATAPTARRWARVRDSAADHERVLRELQERSLRP